ncbi:uncharacterized protein LOC133524809 isoform X2 [Cydia pomonella]|uniref:uncharacterized protein LOC133524809 isoform X2 n=1 Tax=Cydia pomonella TaxID=82600 RepID=UPI002ADDC794|nr:uncharacterized protein LOC133524809 isoform X2 [Cydia pomonella]XP_061716943.1 uncharacterized protein LOC133524809 isoform X2 [Cydia pomonella]
MEDPARKWFARGSHSGGIHARDTSAQLWDQISRLLKSMDRATKSVKEWSKHWSNMKNALKTKIRAINNSFRGTGGGSPKGGEIIPIELRMQAILGSQFASRLPDVAISPGTPEEDANINLQSKNINNTNTPNGEGILQDRGDQNILSEKIDTKINMIHNQNQIIENMANSRHH